MVPSLKKKDDINTSIKKVKETLEQAKKENNTRLVRIIEKCLKRLQEQKDRER